MTTIPATYSAMRLFSSRYITSMRGMPAFAPDTGEGEGSADTNGTSAPAASKPTDQEASLLREVMKLKNQVKERQAQLDAFAGINPDKIHELIAQSERSKAAAREAENDRLLDAGKFQEWKARFDADHRAQLAERERESAEASAEIERSRALVVNLSIANAFASNSFIKDETLLTSSKARKLYGDHFEVEEDGKLVAFNEPRGTDSRLPMVDADGEPLSFNDAIKALVYADPDRDSLLRASRLAKIANDGRAATVEKFVAPGVNRIASAVQQGALAKMTAHLDAAAAHAEAAKLDQTKVTNPADIAHNRITSSVRDSQLSRLFRPGL